MTAAVNTLRDGHTFQARQFWWRAASLLDADSPLARVGFEVGPKGFDDLWVEYKPGRHMLGLHRQHYQCKWHVATGVFGHGDLIDPDFTNATSVSFLQRAHQAHGAVAPAKSELTLLTNWTIKPGDTLAKLVHMRDGRLRLDDLFKGKTTASETGRMRNLWRSHLNIDDPALRVLVGSLSFGFSVEPLSMWRDLLDMRLAKVGLQVDPPERASTWYDDLVYQWLAQGRQTFDRTSLLQLCQQNGLLAKPATPKRFFGVKSFEHPIDKLDERCVSTLDLTGHFKDRQVRAPQEWSSRLYPAVAAFLRDAARTNDPVSLAFDAHATLAFAAGAALTLKPGRTIELEQRVLDRRLWRADDMPRDPAWPDWSYSEELADGAGELVVAISLTHDVSRDVRAYVSEAGLAGPRVFATIAGGPSSTSVQCGTHAFDLARAVAQRVVQLRKPGATVHLFIAAPNVFTFFLGQHQQLMGKVSLYEFDFGGSGGYQLSLSLPVSLQSDNSAL